jgi:hypothetical protein
LIQLKTSKKAIQIKNSLRLVTLEIGGGLLSSVNNYHLSLGFVWAYRKFHASKSQV